jgi:hypothetical protein
MLPATTRSSGIADGGALATLISIDADPAESELRNSESWTSLFHCTRLTQWRTFGRELSATWIRLPVVRTLRERRRIGDAARVGGCFHRVLAKCSAVRRWASDCYDTAGFVIASVCQAVRHIRDQLRIPCVHIMPTIICAVSVVCVRETAARRATAIPGQPLRSYLSAVIGLSYQ